MKEANVSLRLDSFLDQGAVRRVEGILRNLMAEKGHQFAEVKSRVEELPGGPKLVKVVFDINEGPEGQGPRHRVHRQRQGQRRHAEAEDEGDQGALVPLAGSPAAAPIRKRSSRRTPRRSRSYYREKGYVQARIGTPEIKTLEDSQDKETRWVQLRIPVTEGTRYRVGEVKFEGNTVVKTEFLQPLFKLKPGECYSEKDVRKGFEKSREMYGGGGYFEFTGFPDMEFLEPAEGPVAGPGAADREHRRCGCTEGEQYFVNRITFTGNTTTRDNVIRREMRLVEGGVFSTEALKYSVRRLNQLGYFQNLEQSPDAVDVQKTPAEKNQVDVTLKLQEQNRNQLTFGAGVSQFEGFFGQLSFQTSNFLGRGESLTLSLQAGSRAENYQVAFTEPFLFDRNITGGVDVFKRSLQYINQFTQKSTGGNILFGFPVADFSRMFMTYSYEGVQGQRPQRSVLRSALLPTAKAGCRDIDLDDPIAAEPRRARTAAPQPVPAGLAAHRAGRQADHQQGRRRASCSTRSTTRSSRSTGRRLSLSSDFAGFGGNTNFIKPRAEAVGFFRHTARTSIGFRAQVEYIRPIAGDQRSCRSSSGCSSAVSTASAASTSARSVRATRSRSW